MGLFIHQYDPNSVYLLLYDNEHTTITCLALYPSYYSFIRTNAQISRVLWTIAISQYIIGFCCSCDRHMQMFVCLLAYQTYRRFKPPVENAWDYIKSSCEHLPGERFVSLGWSPANTTYGWQRMSGNDRPKRPPHLG